MSHGLNISKDAELDFLVAGGVGAPARSGIIPFRKATECQIHVSGGEFNVAANLSDCFGMKTAIASAMSDYPIGDLIAERVRAMGVKPFYKHFQARRRDRSEHGGRLQRPRLGRARSGGFLQPRERGGGATEAGGFRLEGDLCRMACAGCTRGGIFAALSPTTAPLAAEMMKEAKAAGAITSFDLNFREKLWKISGGNERAVEIIGSIVENVDVLVGNEEDLQKGLGIPGPEVAAKSKLDPSVFFGMIDNVVKKHPQCEGGGHHAARGALDQPA
jgi:2-dehydro-3-deoxygluconokinase